MTVFYINRSSGERPYPKWRTGKWMLGVTGESSPTGGAAVCGTYTMRHGMLDLDVNFSLTGELTDHSLHAVSIPEPLPEPSTNNARKWNEEVSKLRPSTLRGPDTTSKIVEKPALAEVVSGPLSFIRVLTRVTPDETGRPAFIVFGFLHTARERTTTVAPFLLCPEGLNLSVNELRGICGLVEFYTRATKLDINLEY